MSDITSTNVDIINFPDISSSGSYYNISDYYETHNYSIDTKRCTDEDILKYIVHLFRNNKINFTTNEIIDDIPMVCTNSKLSLKEKIKIKKEHPNVEFES